MGQKSIPTVQQEIDHLNKTKDRVANVIAELEKANTMLHKKREHRHEVAPEVYLDLNVSEDKVAELERQLESVFSRTRIKAIESLIELCEGKVINLTTEINKLNKQLKPSDATKKSKAANEGELKRKRKVE